MNDQIIENKKILDKIDIKEVVNELKITSLSDLIMYLEGTYDNTVLTENNVCEGFLFNCINKEEFLDYLEERYPGDFKFIEKIDYDIVWQK